LALFFNGISAGCAISSKLTGLSIVPFVAAIHVTHLLSQYGWASATRPRAFYIDLITKGCAIAFFAGLVFFASFTAHIIVLPYRGDGEEPTPVRIRDSLLAKGEANPNRRVRTENQSLIWNILALIYYMHSHKTAIGADPPEGSAWYTWPFLTGKWVVFWADSSANLICMGQVVNVYCGTLAVIACALMPFAFRWAPRGFAEDWARIAAFPFAYCASLFPFALVGRPMFFYHYIMPNIFAMTTCAAAVDVFLRRVERIKGMVLAYCQIGAALAFFFWSVWTYGMQTDDFEIRVWNKRWQ
jgi:dolichyl-phosphate-mannose--protein O-mannosyl transferase